MISPITPAAYFAVGLAVGPVLPTLVGLAASQAQNVDTATAAIFLAEAIGNIAMPLFIGAITVRTSVLGLPFIAAVIATSILCASRAIVRPRELAR